ncbi:MAG: hypothetical protein M3Q95_03465 [Bacteroidota bacterium]|nr:hypothetical protein [Bacteroidota bacterium]
MKTFIWAVLVSICILPLPAISQEVESPRKGYLAILFGPSLSQGNFSDNTWINEKSGFAKNGYNYTIMEFGFKFIPNFGLCAAIKGAVIPLDVQALANGYAQEYGGQFTVTSTRWGYTGFFVGPFVSIPTKYVDIDFKFQTGLLVAVSPAMTVTRGAEIASQESAVGSSLGFNGGVMARVHLSRRLSLVAQGEYHVSNPAFTITYYDTSNNNETVQTGQLFTMFNFSFGAALRIF